MRAFVSFIFEIDRELSGIDSGYLVGIDLQSASDRETEIAIGIDDPKAARIPCNDNGRLTPNRHPVVEHGLAPAVARQEIRVLGDVDENPLVELTVTPEAGRQLSSIPLDNTAGRRNGAFGVHENSAGRIGRDDLAEIQIVLLDEA